MYGKKCLLISWLSHDWQWKWLIMKVIIYEDSEAFIKEFVDVYRVAFHSISTNDVHMFILYTMAYRS